MKRISRKVLLAFLASCALISGCGGGGGDGGGPAPAPAGASSVDVSRVWVSFLSASGTWSTRGVAPDGKTYTLTLESAPGAPALFQRTGESGSTTRQSVTVSAPGTPAETFTRVLYFNASELFGIESSDGTCSIVPVLGALPGRLPIGSSGSLSTSYDFDTCAPQPFHDGVTSNEWTLVNDAGVTLFCITSQEYDQAGSIVGREQICLEATEDGRLGTRARFTVYFSDTSALVAENF